jgi:LysM repeat protein
VSSGTGAGQDTPGTYTVVKGDMLYAIALRYGTTPQVLATLNELADPNVIEVGQVLLLPSAGPS